MEEAEQVHWQAVHTYEALWAANPHNVDIGNGLGRALANLGALLYALGQADEAAHVCHRSMIIRQELWMANPHNIDVTLGYAGSLCSVRRFDEAIQLVHAVL